MCPSGEFPRPVASSPPPAARKVLPFVSISKRWQPFLLAFVGFVGVSTLTFEPNDPFSNKRQPSPSGGMVGDLRFQYSLAPKEKASVSSAAAYRRGMVVEIRNSALLARKSKRALRAQSDFHVGFLLSQPQAPDQGHHIGDNDACGADKDRGGLRVA